MRVPPGAFRQHHPSGASAPTACHCADPVQVVTAYKFFPTVSRAPIISGKKAVVG